MTEIRVEREQVINAPASTVYNCIADCREHHPHFLPPAFSDFRVEEGGIGAGTVISYKLTAGGRTRAVRAVVAEPEPGRVLTESDTLSSIVTTFTVTPRGEQALVNIATRWTSAGGIGGFFERTFAPRLLRRLYEDELARLDAYARSLASPTASG
jgi:hypothetical protein